LQGNPSGNQTKETEKLEKVKMAPLSWAKEATRHRDVKKKLEKQAGQKCPQGTQGQGGK